MKGFISNQQVHADRSQLTRAELALHKARKDSKVKEHHKPE
jgi:hypothetical protein